MVPKSGNVKGLILQKAHESPISIHPGSTKMYQDLRRQFWWECMKRDIASYVTGEENLVWEPSYPKPARDLT